MPATRLERLCRINDLLQQLLELPPADQEALLLALAPEEAELMPMLRSMLQRASSDTTGFLREPIQLGAWVDSLLPGDQPGDNVGPWRLVRQLGEGGMATVWLASRIDKTFEREVALKLPRAAWSAGVMQRIGRERALLAQLEHSNIARLYEAGVTMDGRPWLAMERVEGEPIDAYCRNHGYGIKEILGLLLQVCEALSHAHARLIVHRDLKPDNILVTPQGQVRLVDFGVGGLLQDAAEVAGTSLTQVLGRALTPDYASPELVTGQSVGVASDLYSLGIVAYELLSGQRPYRLSSAGNATLEHAILTAEVPRCSSRAARPEITRALRGDLDAVLARALAKRPNERYPSIEAFGADLRAWLDRRPVVAVSPNWIYLSAKFVLRHRTLVVSVVSVMLVLGTTLAIALAQARRADHQLRMTMDQIYRSEALSDLTTYALFDIANRNELITLAQIHERAGHYAARGQDPMRRAVALKFLATWHMHRGDSAAAERMVDSARDTLPRESSPGFESQLSCLKGNIISSKGQHDEARELILQSLQNAQQDLDAHTYCLQTMSTVAGRRPGGAEESEKSALKALALLEDTGPALTRRRAFLSGNLASAFGQRGRWLDADRMFARSWELLVEANATEGPAASGILANWAGMMLAAGRPNLAMQRYEEASTALRQNSPDGAVHPVMQVQIAVALAEMGYDSRALEAYSDAISRAQATGSVRIETFGRVGRGLSLLNLDRRGEAYHELQMSELLAPEVVRDLRGHTGVRWVVLKAHLAHSNGQRIEAETILRDALREQQQLTPDSVLRLYLLLALAKIHTVEGRPQDSTGLLLDALSHEERGRAPSWPSARIGQLLLALGRAERATGDGRAARLFAAASAELESALGADNPLAVHARQLSFADEVASR